MNIREWFGNLDAREQRMAIVAAAVLGVLVFFSVWLSFTHQASQLDKTVAEQRALRQWMQKSAQEAEQLRNVLRISGKVNTSQSLLALTDQTARQGRLGGALKREEPEGQNIVRVWLEQAAFDDVVEWLDDLQRRFGVSVTNITVDKRDMPGRVDARITLEKTAP
jgi:general secretion pathway protein M